MVRVLEEMLGRKAVVTYVPVPQLGDVLVTHANISAAGAALGYAPRHGLRDGLRAFVDWYQDYYGKDGGQMAADERAYVPD